jgi:hypothetical protein
MAVYFGVVRDNHIELEGGTRLAEGTRVEVRPLPADASDMAAAEELVKARLRAAGLLAPVRATDGEADDEEFEPVVVRGEPLSEQIVRERR